MIKAQCQCGHKVAVSDSYGGKRVKCARCGGAITVPRGGEGVLVATLVDDSATVGMPAPKETPRPQPRAHAPRSRRHQHDHRQQARGKRVAIIVSSLFAVVLTVAIVVLVNYDPEKLPAALADNTQPKGKNPPLFDDPSLRPRGSSSKAKTPADDEETMPGKEAGGEGGDETVTIAGQQFTDRGDVPPVETTASFDAASNTTTIRSRPTKLTVGERLLEMTIEAKHEGQTREAGGAIEVRMRLKGDMRGLISAANTDEPVMLIALDGRDPLQLSPVAKAEADDRKEEDGPVNLPAWVEYGLDGSTLTALRKANETRVALGDEEVTFSPDQMKLLKMLGN